MRDVKSRNRYRLGRVAAGPVSFVQDGERFTTFVPTSRAVTLCASTYLYAVKRGWETEVL